MQPVQVSADVYAWLAEFGLAKPKAGGGGGAKAGAQALPARLVAGLLSGETLVDLFNAMFSRHSVKLKLVYNPGDRQKTWSQVSKGLHRLSVELDEEMLSALAAGDLSLLTDLLEELCGVYRQWAVSEAKKRRKKQAERQQQPQAQPQQGYGYGGRYGRPAAAANVESPARQELPAGPPSPSDVAGRGPQHGGLDSHRSDAEADAEASELGGESFSAEEDALEAPSSQRAPGSPEPSAPPSAPPSPPPPAAPARRAEPRRARQAAEEASDPEAYAPLEQRSPPAPGQSAAARAAAAAAPGREAEEALAQLSAEKGLETAQSAAELLGLSLLHGLRIGPSQARSLLADGGRRLGRAFADGSERNCAHMARWIESLEYFGGALSEMLLLQPPQAPFVLQVLGHGLRAASADIAEATCRLLARVCTGLAENRLRRSVREWLLEPPALKDLCALLARRSSVRTYAAALCRCCCHDSLMAVLTQDLKQMSHSEQDYLSSAHSLLCACLEHADLAEECWRQGAGAHFLERCVQRLGDDATTAGTQQAAAIFATDLWLLADPEASGLTAAEGGLEALLEALRRVSRSRQAVTAQLVALSCLSRMLAVLCDRRDPVNTPAVYRTLVYALVEAESTQARDFAMRNLITLIQQQEGVPVGILVELMASKFQVEGASPCAADVELFLVIARHPRCTVRHAELLAQVLARCGIESHDLGRAAGLPLLVLLQRFARDGAMAAFFEQFVQVALTCLLRKGSPKGQAVRIHELLAKVACLQEPVLEATLRRLLNEVCRAYLTSYEMLHPNLQALLDLWPEDVEALGQWADEQFAPPPEDPPPSEPPPLDEPSSLGLQSVTPSLPQTPLGEASNGASPSHPATARAQRVEEGDEPGSEAEQGEVSAAESQGLPSPSGSAAEPSASEAGSPRQLPASGRQDAQVERLSRETEGLRQELEMAKEQQRKALEEAEMLRNELSEAQALHRRVEDEIAQLQRRREELLVQKAGRQQPQAAGQEKPKRRKPQAAATHSPEDLEKAAELVTAFQEPLRLLFSKYSHKRTSQSGSRQAVSMDAFEKLLSEAEVLPTRLPRKAIPQAIRVAGVQLLDDSSLLQEHFLALLPQLAVRSFGVQEATPFRDFGVPVPIEGEPPVRLQVQALLQHLARAAETSRVAALRCTRPAFSRALRLHVLHYAETSLVSLNARLERGEDLPERDIPEGFEVVDSGPTATYCVPEGLPVPASERHCVEILDALLADALGVHFLEPLPVAGPGRRAAVRGHADLSALAPEPAAPAEPKQASRLARAASDRDVSLAHARDQAAPVAQPQPEGREARKQPLRAQHSPPPADSRRRPPKDRRAQRAPPEAQDAGQPGRQNEATQRPQSLSENRKQQRPSPTQAAPEASPPPAPRASPPQQRRSISQPPVGNSRRVSAEAPRTEAGDAAPGPADPARAAAKRQDKMMQRYRANAEEGKGRQETIQAALRSEPVQRLVRSVEPNLKRAFDFFARWKGGGASTMPLLGFLSLGECFGILGKESLKVVFRSVGGQGLSFETFPDALFLCVVRVAEVERGEGQPASADDAALWSRGFQDLCRHMQLVNGKALRGCMDAYRRDGEVLPPFSLAEARSATLAPVPDASGEEEGEAPAGDALSSEVAAEAELREPSETALPLAPGADDEAAAEGATPAREASPAVQAASPEVAAAAEEEAAAEPRAAPSREPSAEAQVELVGEPPAQAPQGPEGQPIEEDAKPAELAEPSEAVAVEVAAAAPAAEVAMEDARPAEPAEVAAAAGEAQEEAAGPAEAAAADGPAEGNAASAEDAAEADHEPAASAPTADGQGVAEDGAAAEPAQGSPPAAEPAAAPEPAAPAGAEAAPPAAADAPAAGAVAEAAAAEPAAAEPAVAEPAVAEPAVAEPAAAEPAVAEPDVAEPAAAGPGPEAPPVAEPADAAGSPAEAEPPAAAAAGGEGEGGGGAEAGAS